MLTDATAIGLSLVAIPLAQRPAKGALNFGLKRTEILAAQFNGATLLVLALLIIYEGITRLITPPAVAGTGVMGSWPAHARSGFTLETRAHPDRAWHPASGSAISRAVSPPAPGSTLVTRSAQIGTVVTPTAGGRVGSAPWRRP
jgi:Cation efflux family